ncbi:MAG TPA: hypothetical protein VG826_16330 [Pirellulales bacterium]|nr:hypothetical protein [Pirellulales bacterium]
MKTRGIIGLGVIVSALADAAAILCGTGHNFPHPGVVIGYALLFAQASVGAIWLAIGSSALLLRILAHFVLLAVLYLGLSRLHDNYGEWLWLLAAQTLAVVAPLAVGRWCGLRLQVTSLTADEQPWQFTLRHVFALTTICAVVLSLIRLMPRRNLDSRLAEAAVIGSGFALMALVAAWVAMGYGRWFFKLLALPIVTLLVGLLLVALGGVRPSEDAWVMTLVFCQMLFLTGWLGVLRHCGFRLVRLGGSSHLRA